MNSSVARERFILHWKTVIDDRFPRIRPLGRVAFRALSNGRFLGALIPGELPAAAAAATAEEEETDVGVRSVTVQISVQLVGIFLSNGDNDVTRRPC